MAAVINGDWVAVPMVVTKLIVFQGGRSALGSADLDMLAFWCFVHLVSS
jgi:hypothetical protein